MYSLLSQEVCGRCLLTQSHWDIIFPEVAFEVQTMYLDMIFKK